MSENAKVQQLPLLPLRDLIIFPHMMMPLFVGRDKSINALEEAMSKQTDIVLAAQLEKDRFAIAELHLARNEMDRLYEELEALRTCRSAPE